MHGMIPTPGLDTAGVFTPWTGKPSDYKLIVDYFAGGGGASKGIEMALGRSPDIAVNHDAEAIALHRANHPDTMHLQNDVWSVMPEMVKLIGNRPIELFHASPDCKHFSKAKGGKPVKRKIRDLAWVVPQFARRFRPEVITLENVEEFAGWGPLVQKIGADGRPSVDAEGRPHMVPCKQRKGETFAQWVHALERLGYRVAWKELRASDLRAPTIRKRLFVIARRDGLPIVLPEATHGDPDRPTFKAKKLKKWRTAAECIDWSLPCPSIFATAAEIKEEHGLRAVRPLAENTMARVAKGVFRFVIDNPKPFIVNLTHHGEGRCESVEEPFKTITGAHRGEKAIILPSITRFNTGAVGSPIDEPLSTITANSFIKRAGGCAPIGLVEATVAGPFLAGVGGRMGQTENRSVDTPAQTLTAKADTVIIAPTLIQSGYGERKGQEPRALDLDHPLGTVVAGGIKHAVIAPIITRAQHSGGSTSADAPAHTVAASRKDQNQVVAAHLMTMRNAQKPFNEADKPAHTICADGARLHMVAAFLAKHYGGHETPGAAFDEPMSTVTAQDHHAVVHAGLINLKGSDRRMSAPDAPAAALTAQGNHQGPVTAFLTKYHRDGGQHAPVDDPSHTIDCKARFGLCTVMLGDEPWVIVDIGMRMLTPRELFNAQGFSSDYIIDHGLFEDAQGNRFWKKLSQTASVRLVGNSVCPDVEYAVIAANFPKARVHRRAAA
jgi:DNA (cytosine-5)-methyltransferase 1